MPAQAVQDLNAQSPDGRRPTLQNMGLVRRMSHTAPVDGASHTDRRARRPSEVPSPPSVTDGGRAFTASSAAASVAKPCNVEVGPRVSLAEIASGSCRDDPLVKPHDLPDAPDEDEYQTLPDEVPEEVAE
jgi:hypothetical protein